jgi:hypothetical protein
MGAEDIVIESTEDRAVPRRHHSERIGDVVAGNGVVRIPALVTALHVSKLPSRAW